MAPNRYAGCDFYRTNTTTDVYRSAFGRTYRAVESVWEVSGRLRKNACQRPFLTSATACRNWIREQDTTDSSR